MAPAAMVTYLAMNGFTWKCGEVEEIAMVLRAAAKEIKEIKEDEWEAWVVSNVGKRNPRLGDEPGIGYLASAAHLPTPGRYGRPQ